LGEKSCGDKRDGENRYLQGCYYCQLKRPLHWKEKIPVAASPQKLEQEVLHCVDGLIAEFEFGYVKEFLFFLLMPLVFTAQK